MTTATSASDPFSPRSSVGSGTHSTDSSCLPRRRIRCSKAQIAVGDCRYESASDALLAYLRQFEEIDQIGLEKGSTPGINDDVKTPMASLACTSNGNGLIKEAVEVCRTSSVDAGARKPGVIDPTAKGASADVMIAPPKLVGRGLAGSGLVLGTNGIAVAGTREDVEDLLTSKVTPQLQEEVTDTLREVKLRRLLKRAALKSKSQTKTGLQQEVEAALIRSAELLEKVTREDIPSTKQVTTDLNNVTSSNSSTLNTELEALLLGNMSLLEDAGVMGEDTEVRSVASLPITSHKSGHTYSYHTSRPSRSRQRQTLANCTTDSLSQSERCVPVSYPAPSCLSRAHRASSIDSLLPPPSASLNSTLQLLLNPKDYASKRDTALISPESSDSLPSNQSDPTDLLRQIRSRSVPPGSVTGRRNHHAHRDFKTDLASVEPTILPDSFAAAPDWVHELDESVRKSVPSWVGEIEPSEMSDSVWIHEALLNDENNKRPMPAAAHSKVPSWIGQAEDPDSNDMNDSQLLDTSQPALIPMMSTPIKPMDTGNNREWNLEIQKDNITAGRNSPTSNNITSLSNDSRPGLNFSDLNTSHARTQNNKSNHLNTNNISSSCSNGKHVSFTDKTTEFHEKPSSLLPLSSTISSPSSSLLRKVKTTTSSSHLSNSRSSSSNKQNMSSPAPSKVLDSEYNGEAFLRNSILPQTARLKKSMDTFAASSENLRRRSASSSASSEASGASGASTGNRCSSLDTVALLTGYTLTRSQRQQVLSGDGSMTGAGGSGRGLDQESSSDGLDGDRPWERLVNTIKAPVPVGADSSGNETSNGHVSQQHLESTLSGGKQPGSMEALKNMLFKLQAEETSTQDDSDRRGEEAFNSSLQNVSNSSMAVIPALENYDFKQEPGGHSLEKALVHLNRLKRLVKTTPTSASSASAGSEGDLKPESPTANGVSNDIR
ncbi:lung adenoma susceptibility protein 2 [Plakobranchus ocellatus]|uniref:Lung adenoma susceptibility protein 2 n=1 Tax=Plakobranchus ocellatus TaxID=259542 RepID=A0AAV4B6I8_9GAST|nr:lung adenoma susceptibility protein 2 [Plakobranchus ocellatus]